MTRKAQQARRARRSWVDVHTRVPQMTKETEAGILITHRRPSMYEALKIKGKIGVWPPAVFAALYINGDIVMSDVPTERRTCQPFLDEARGRVLVVGLGLGTVLFPLEDDPEVASIDVVEREPDIIEWVEPHLDPSVRILNEDACVFEPDGLYDCIWLDIWPGVGPETLAGTQELLERYRPHLAPGGWIGCWNLVVMKEGAPMQALWPSDRRLCKRLIRMTGTSELPELREN